MISIIVPVYNAEHFIDETIESVLRQSCTDFELLLVDDCSTDGSAAKILEYADRDKRVKLISQPANKGAAAARNRGVSEALGRYIAFLDSDDLWTEDKLQKSFDHMQKKNAGFVFTGYEFVDEEGAPTGARVHVPECLDFKHALLNTNIFTSTVLIDTEKISKSLCMMPDMESEDTATWWTILKAGHKAYGLNECLVKYRRTSGTLSANKLKAIRRIWNLYRRVAGLSVPNAALHMVSWAVTATLRRL